MLKPAYASCDHFLLLDQLAALIRDKRVLSLPIVDLHQEKYWLPDARKDYGWLYQAYLWLHIIFGWILTTVLVAGLTGLVKKD